VKFIAKYLTARVFKTGIAMAKTGAVLWTGFVNYLCYYPTVSLGSLLGKLKV
jgi:hypothetical protein